MFGTRGFPNVEGGVEKHCEELYPLLSRDVVLTIFRRKPYICDIAEYTNIKFIDLPSTKIKGIEALLHSLLATLCVLWQKPDVVHIHNIGPALFSPLLKLFSIPVILTFHSPNYEHKKWGYFAKKLLRLSERVALKFSDKIIFVNRLQMEKYPDKIRKKSRYVPNGIHLRDRSEGQECLTQFNLQGRRYILSVGRITPEKGFHTLIEAFRELGDQNCVLVIAGGVEFESDYKRKLEELADGLSVIFTGYVQGETLAQLYSHADLFVLASENEGFPLVLLEAMNYRRNIVVSDIPATHLMELQQTDYFTVGDVSGLAERMKQKLNGPSYRIYNLSDFSWEQCAQQVLETYWEAVK